MGDVHTTFTTKMKPELIFLVVCFATIFHLNLALESQIIIVDEDELYFGDYEDFPDDNLDAEITGDCPGGQLTCSNSQTCCQMIAGNYGCCPFPNAVCCSDGKSCCPQGAKCDMINMRCNYDPAYDLEYGLGHDLEHDLGHDLEGGEDWISAEYPIASILDNSTLLSNDCPSPNPCQSKQTCCLDDQGAKGCCPYQDGNCCAYGLHCCPASTVCDLEKMQCVRSDGFEDIYKIIPKILQPNIIYEETDLDYFEEEEIISKDSNQCDDPKEKCPEGETCCTLEKGVFGCCPYANATWCKDMIHCCPHGLKCDIVHGKCVPEDVFTKFFIPLYSMEPKKSDVVVVEELKNEVVQKFNDVLCPNPEEQCPKGQTCCLMNDVDYGCCPLDHAVCCDDRLHCCPQGTKCEMDKGACVSNNGNRANSTSIPINLTDFLYNL